MQQLQILLVLDDPYQRLLKMLPGWKSTNRLLWDSNDSIHMTSIFPTNPNSDLSFPSHKSAYSMHELHSLSMQEMLIVASASFLAIDHQNSYRSIKPSSFLLRQLLLWRLVFCCFESLQHREKSQLLIHRGELR